MWILFTQNFGTFLNQPSSFLNQFTMLTRPTTWPTFVSLRQSRMIGQMKFLSLILFYYVVVVLFACWISIIVFKYKTVSFSLLQLLFQITHLNLQYISFPYWVEKLVGNEEYPLGDAINSYCCVKPTINLWNVLPGSCLFHLCCVWCG